MDMFFIKISEFLPFVDESSFTGNYKSKKHLIESNFGKFITELAAKTQYKIQDTETIIENSKPKFKNSKMCFSISHSNDIAAVIFDKHNIGLDIEFIKERDFNSISGYLNLPVKNPDKLTFYKLWTNFEAEYKSKKQKLTSFILEKDYMCSISSFKHEKINLYEIKSKGKHKKIDLQNINPENFKYESIEFNEL
ncbi:MAG: hypothetical protein LKG27_00140 [Clostridiaceae bacterium]|jgi:hypothetical protein|nr:hypothetical protein [Clostridiaceae bacterium]